MATIHSKASISENLNDATQQFAVYINLQDDSKFTQPIDDKWSSAQHLEHLLKSVQLVNKGLHKPKFMYRFIFDKNTRDGSRSFEELKNRYYERLKDLKGITNPQTAPGEIKLSQKKEKLKTFLAENRKLIKKMNSLSDENLDGIVLPHPALGKITIREMMNFMIFHTQHHHNSIKNKI